MSGRLLDFFKPFEAYLPDVIAPQRKVPYNQKLIWTGVSLLIFLVLGQIPLYGIVSSETSDPLYWLRAMLASNRGTLMELGVSPIITSSMIFQFLQGTQILQVDMQNKQDRDLFQVAQKVCAIILTFGQAVVVVLTGNYGRPRDLGIAISLLLIFQLMFASFVVLLLDELLSKGYGLGSGISLFTATNIAEQSFWKAFAPTTTNSGRGKEFDGAVIAFFHLLAVRKDKKRALVEAFYRTNAPNMFQVIATVFVFLFVLFLQGFRYELPIRSTKIRGQVGTYPIKLFYTSNTPIMLQTALTSNIFLISQILYQKFPSSPIVRLLGVWGIKPGSLGPQQALSGLSYYIQPPTSYKEIVLDPIKSVVYVSFVLGACALFSKTWIEISGTSPRDVAKQFKEQGMIINGMRDASVYRELKKVIPTAAAFGGATIGALSVCSDVLGTLGSGTSILMATTTIYGYYEMAAKEGGFSKSLVPGFSELM
ncbi:translocon subunit [Zygosaccharomyces mellis]|uniref:Translocon subunit n=1 Tax=Zygosaccharomyces mellis TaxID=42258 RepID=A0A4C2E0V9_9SACH|nr:translocon subunit [Zygosaccharomyces mellis]